MVALKKKIDSNITSLAYAEEAAIGILPGEEGFAGTPAWYQMEPTEYSDFGGTLTTVAPTTINPSRQRRKGVITDLEAAGGFTSYQTFSNLTDLMQGFMFADIRRKGRTKPTAIGSTTITGPTAGYKVGTLLSGTAYANSKNNALHVVETVTDGTAAEIAGTTLAIEASPPAGAYMDVVGFEGAAGEFDIVVTGDLPVLTSSTTDLTTLGLVPGQWIFIGGDTSTTRFSNSVNNGWKRIRTITAGGIVIDKSDSAMIAEASSLESVRIFFGDVLKNEVGSMIKRRSYQLERLLGAPDSDLPNAIQTEVLKGAIPNEFTLNVPTAELMTAELSFVATDNEQRESTLGPKQTDVKSFPLSDEYNTSSDVLRIRLGLVSDTDEASAAMFAYVTEATLSINNNVTPSKAVGVLGAFDATAGTFEVSGEVTAYFTDVTATKAVRNNDSVTLDMVFAKENQGLVYDLPLIGLGNGILEIALDEPITIPLTTDAASGEDVHPDLNHTLLITYFNYLPNAAE